MLRHSLILLLLAVPVALLAQEAAKPASPHAPVSGPKLYQSHCAVCHGVDGKGDGPAAVSLKTWPGDLTTIAKRNGGTFPSLHVAEAIGGERLIPAHGTRDMPVWGPVFRSMAHGHADNAQLRIDNLVSYIESIQE